jgi:hypothetical protein
LKSFTCSYPNFIETLNITSNDKDLAIELLSTKLIPQDRWKKQFRNSSVNEAFEVVLAAKFKNKRNKQSKENDGDNSSKSGKNAFIVEN